MTKAEATDRVLTVLRSVSRVRGPFESDRTLNDIGLTQHQCDAFCLELFIGERLGSDPLRRPSTTVTLHTTLGSIIETYRQCFSPGEHI